MHYLCTKNNEISLYSTLDVGFFPVGCFSSGMQSMQIIIGTRR